MCSIHIWQNKNETDSKTKKGPTFYPQPTMLHGFEYVTMNWKGDGFYGWNLITFTFLGKITKWKNILSDSFRSHVDR